MAEGKPVPGVHLVKAFDGPNNPSRADDAMADDVVEILRDGMRGSTDTDCGGVEDYATTRAKEEADQIEHAFFFALRDRIRERLTWADGRRGLGITELGTRDGWRFAVRDREGRPYEVEITFSQIMEVAQRQRVATLSNFQATLDRVVDALEAERKRYFERRDAVVIH